jgi:hypothetical protein
MPLTLAIITSESDLPQLCETDYAAWQSPYNPQLKHFRPTFPTREEAIAWDKARKTKRLRAQNPKFFMVKCTDTDLDLIIGYAAWEINDRPDPYGERTEAVWHPEGSVEREFAERFINGLWGFIGSRVKGAHMGMHYHPLYPKPSRPIPFLLPPHTKFQPSLITCRSPLPLRAPRPPPPRRSPHADPLGHR